MNLLKSFFNSKPPKKPQRKASSSHKKISTKLISTSALRQANLESFDTMEVKPDLKLWIDLTENGNLSIEIGWKNKSIGKLAKLVTADLEREYLTGDRLNCNIVITSYNIYRNSDKLHCDVTMKIN